MKGMPIYHRDLLKNLQKLWLERDFFFLIDLFLLFGNSASVLYQSAVKCLINRCELIGLPK